MAFARTVNLKPTDLPGFKGARESNRGPSTEKPTEAELARCFGSRPGARGGGSSSQEIASLSSESFSLQHGLLYQMASSSVTVFVKPEVPAGILSAVRSPLGQRCIARVLKTLVKQIKFGSGRLRGASLTTLPASAPGTDGAFGLQLEVAFTVRGVELPFYLDFIGFSAGRAEVLLMTGALLHAPTNAAEQSLLLLLVKRVLAHPI